MVVHQLEDEDAGVSDHDEAGAEHEAAHRQGAPPPVPAPDSEGS